MVSSEEIKIIPISQNNRKEVNKILLKEWNSLYMVVRERKINLKDIDGMVAYSRDEIIGIITYIIYDNIIEIISLNSFKERVGIGTKLLKSIKEKAKNNHCSKIILITTNDNINAIKFYQRKGFVISNIYIDSIKYSRKIKPNIPQKGDFDIPIRDEIEFVLNI